MKKISFLFLLTILLFSCKKKDDIRCDNAQLQVCNSTSDQIVLYSWNTNQIDDTIFPGECTTKDFGEVFITYDNQGNEESLTKVGSFHTLNATYLFDIENCFKVINAPGGYVDISHCYNGKFDADKEEFGVDCGGFCPPCEDMEVPCAANLKTDKIDWQVGADDVLSSAFEIITDSEMQITFRFYSGQEMLVTLPVSSFPAADRTFVIGSEYYQAKVGYSTRFENFDTEQGKTIYFISTGTGTGKIDFCDIRFTGVFNNKIGSGSLKFRD